MSEYVSQCGCKIHVAQWTSKRKLVSIKYCQKHSGEPPAQPSASEGERVEQASDIISDAVGYMRHLGACNLFAGKACDCGRLKAEARLSELARLVPTKGGAK